MVENIRKFEAVLVWVTDQLKLVKEEEAKPDEEVKVELKPLCADKKDMISFFTC